MESGEARARSEEMAGRLRERFGLDQEEAEFVVLVGRSGGVCLVRQAESWCRGRGLPAARRTAFRWVAGLHDKLGTAFETLPLQREGTRSVEVHQLVGKSVYRELGMKNSRWRYPAEKKATLVEIKQRLVRVGAVLSRWWYPWLGTVEASVGWCDALGIDRGVLPQKGYRARREGVPLDETAARERPSYFPDRSPHAAGGNVSVFVYPLVVEGRDETEGLRKWCRSYAPLWQALGRVGVQTTVVVARSAQTLSVPVADVMSGWEASADTHRAVRGIWFDTQLDYVLAGNAPAVLEAHGGPEGVARRRRELAAEIEEARSEVGRGVAKTEELVLEEVPA